MSKPKETVKSETHAAAKETAAPNGVKPPTPLADLMKRMGGTGQFDPLPPDQRKWQTLDGEPVKHRIWAWLVAHTVGNSACRREYAVNQYGHERHIEHIAADLGLDPANVRFSWRDGEKKGLWRRGSKTEGERRLYLCGTISGLQSPEIGEEKGEEEANEKVCTNLLPSLIRKKIKDWPPERVAELGRKWAAIEDFDRELHAVCVAAARSFISQAQDNLLARFGVKVERQHHRKKTESEEEAKERRDRVNPLLPAIENFVQSLAEKSVQPSETPLYRLLDDSVHTSLYRYLETTRDLEKTRTDGQTVTVVSEAPLNGQNGHLPSVRPNGVPKTPPEEKPSLRVQLTEYLRQFKIPTPLEPKDVDAIAAAISTEELLDQFKEATAPDRMQPRKWILLIRTAEKIAAEGARYREAVERKPMSRIERKAEEYAAMRRRERSHAN